MALKKATAKKTVVKKAVKKVSKAKSSESSEKAKKIEPKKVSRKLSVKKTALKKTIVKKVVAKKAIAKKVVVKPIDAKKSTTKAAESAKVTKKVIGERKTKRTLDQTDVLLESIIEGLEEKKAKQITVLDLRELDNRISDYFVIAEGDSNTHVDAISGSVEEIVKKISKERPYRVEGVENSEWIIIDYVNIVVHIFQREARAYYRLEELWADAKVQHISR
jgi:ribosome-associated protein